MPKLIIRGPDGAEREAELLKRITSVGPDPENDVVLADPGLPPT